MFIQTETTPNPATLKFLPGRLSSPKAQKIFPTQRKQPTVRRLPRGLFGIPASQVCFSAMISFPSPRDGPEWQHLKPAVLGTIMEHFMSGEPVMAGNRSNAATERRRRVF